MLSGRPSDSMDGSCGWWGPYCLALSRTIRRLDRPCSLFFLILVGWEAPSFPLFPFSGFFHCILAFWEGDGLIIQSAGRHDAGF